MISGRVVSTLVAKDVMLYFRNRFFAVITVLGVGACAGVGGGCPAVALRWPPRLSSGLASG